MRAGDTTYPKLFDHHFRTTLGFPITYLAYVDTSEGKIMFGLLAAGLSYWVGLFMGPHSFDTMVTTQILVLSLWVSCTFFPP